MPWQLLVQEVRFLLISSTQHASCAGPAVRMKRSRPSTSAARCSLSGRLRCQAPGVTSFRSQEKTESHGKQFQRAKGQFSVSGVWTAFSSKSSPAAQALAEGPSPHLARPVHSETTLSQAWSCRHGVTEQHGFATSQGQSSGQPWGIATTGLCSRWQLSPMFRTSGCGWWLRTWSGGQSGPAPIKGHKLLSCQKWPVHLGAACKLWA